MKKLLLVLLLTLPICGFAQKGMQGIGANLGLEIVEPFDDGWSGGTFNSLGLKYMYNITNHVGIAPYLNIVQGEYYRNISGGNVDYYAEITKCGINAHYYIFRSIKRFRPYAVGGLFYISFTELCIDDYYRNHYADKTESQFGVSLGVGAEYRITYRLLFQIETLMNLHYDMWVENTLLIMPSLTYIF